MYFKDISYLELLQPFCSAGQNHYAIFRGFQEEQFCEIILNLDQWFRSRCCLKIFFIWSPGGPLFSGAEPFVQFGRGYYEEQF